uniref:asparagine synthase-related protein n=1 Tax=Salmonella sp. SAL4450 TaxID=3159905 RepID=UPI00397D0B61
AYVRAAFGAVRGWLSRVPIDEPVAVAFSGGIDSTATLLLARHACQQLGRNPESVRAFTLDVGGGTDAAQAESAVRALGMASAWERIDMAPE